MRYFKDEHREPQKGKIFRTDQVKLIFILVNRAFPLVESFLLGQRPPCSESR